MAFHKETFMSVAEVMAQESKAERLKVGCVLVKNDRIISTGINGTPKGFDNTCEDENGNTKPEVIHGERNAIYAAAKVGISLDGCDVFSTYSCCSNCALSIISIGAKNFYYRNTYRDTIGLDILRNAGINVEKI